MRDNLSIIITMLVFVILIVIFPLYNYFERQDDMSYNLVLKSTTNFVDAVINSGYIDQELYDNFIQELAVTGNLYDVQLEAHKKIYTKDPNNLGADTYIEQYNVDYNPDIFDEESGKTQDSNVKIDNKVLKDGAYYLNVGDQIYAKVKNSSTTMAGAIFNLIVPTSKEERLAVNYGGIIKNNAWEKQEISNLFQKDIYISMRLDVSTTPGFSEKINDRPTFSLDNNSQINFIVKVVNYAPEENITELLRNNLKITGFTGDKFIQPNAVSKISNTSEWKVTFNLNSITNITEYFGSDFYKTCQLELEAGKIQGNYYRNESVKSDSISIKKTNVQQKSPEITGPFLPSSASVVSEFKLESSVKYYVKYYESNLTVTKENFAKDYVTAVGFEYENLKIQKDTSQKRFILTFEKISGTPNTNFNIKIKSDWAQYYNESYILQNVGELVSNSATLKLPMQEFKESGYYSFTVPVTGRYRLTVIGANGGGGPISTTRGSQGGKGGMTSGEIRLTKGTKLHIFVGGVGKSAINGSSDTGGFNGGGNGSRYPTNHETFPNSFGAGGGGGTDIRINSKRIIVAGGGGGSDDYDDTYAGEYRGHNDGSGGDGGGGNKPGRNGYLNGSASGAGIGGPLKGGRKEKGYDAPQNIDLGGGGGGYYGGTTGTSGNAGGGGGSGYISTSGEYKFTNITGETGFNKGENGGDGSATIEYVGT